MRNVLFAGILACSFGSLHAQEVNYDEVSFTQSIPALYPSLQQNISFDVRASVTERVKDSFLSADELNKMRTVFQSPMRVKFGKFSQVDSTGDFHVVVLIQRFKWVKPAASSMPMQMSAPKPTGLAANVALHTRVYDKFGTLLYDESENYPELSIPAESDWGSGYDRKDPKTRTLIATQEAISASLLTFVNQIYGFTPKLTSKLAYLDGVKKKSELKQFEDQVEQLRTLLRKEGSAQFLTASEAYLPFWEKMASYKGEGEVNEVKRAALQNLSLVSILKGDFEKADAYITAYKPIDKPVKSLFGLIKTRNSDDLELLLYMIQAKPEKEIKPSSDKVLTISDVLKLNAYMSIDGTIVLEGKNAGTYQGMFQVKRPEPQLINQESNGNMLDLGTLGAEDLLISIPTTDKSGKAQTLIVRGSVVKSLKGADGTDYQVRKFGTVGFANGAIWYLLRANYQSPKVTVFQSVLPNASEYVVMKPGDEKGVKSSYINARRNILDYFKDCSSLEEKYKKGNTPFDIKQVALDYTNCQ
ncbi:hypothetical protein GCM10028803_57640 [Larkinella knui]|uniref:Uncharacterized protein n=1 Tax=Larkinella knui TaxID=2025310 RepID=A0A3P1CHP5_9BACT|nr:hypothetical protein [Larkinella knui]RRB12797.1 hypothetical protein EHT87_21715 [Larkinella knui]